jgi:hypothetical protein
VIETASQQPATLKDEHKSLQSKCKLGYCNYANSGPSAVSRTKSQRSFAASKFVKTVNSVTQNAIGYALSRLLDTTQGDIDDVSKLTIKEVIVNFAVCRGNSNINGAPIGRLVDENLRKERAMLAQ